MYKKIFHTILVLAVIAFSASCSKTEPEQTSAITFATSIAPDIATRALSDGSGIDQVVCAAYLGGNLIASTTAPVADGAANVTLELANNRTYDIVMWASKSGSTLWSFDPETASVAATYANQAASSAANDAFWYRGTITPNGPEAFSIELTRAVAQIYVGTSTAFTSVSDVTLSATGIHNGWNLLTGALSEDVANVEFTLGAAPAGETFTIGSDTYYIIGMACVLAPAAETATDVAFSMTRDATPVSKTVNNTSIRRNWCTRIAGAF